MKTKTRRLWISALLILTLALTMGFAACKRDGKTDPSPTPTSTPTATQPPTVSAVTPAIGTQPADATVERGGTHTLTVTASVTDGGTLSYQWYTNTSAANAGGAAISGAVSASYTVPTGTAGTYHFYVTVTNTNNAVNGTKTASVTSNAASVVVSPQAIVNAGAPAIGTQPADATVERGGTHTLTVAATSPDNGALSYQWYSNGAASNSGGTLINGANFASYPVPTSAAGTLYYYVIITNTNDGANGAKTASVTSRAAQITVAVNAAAPVISGEPADAPAVEFGTAHPLTVTATSPDGGVLSYQWYENSTASTSGGTAIANATGANYSVPVTAAAGTHYYYVKVTNTNNSVNGTKTASVTSRAVTVTVTVTNAHIPTVDRQPSSGAVQQGGTHSVSVAASVKDGGTLSYQWYSNSTESNEGGTLIDGGINADFAVPSDTVDTYYYYVIVTNTNPAAAANTTASVTSAVITVTVTTDAVTNAETPVITAQPSGGDPVIAGQTKNLSVTVTPVTDGGTLTYQWYSNNTNTNAGGTAIAVDGTGASYSVPTSTAGTYYFYVIVTNTNNAVNGTKIRTAVSAAVTVTVTAKTIVRIDVTTAPSKTAYLAGDTFDPAGMVVTATYNDGSTEAITDYTYSQTALTAGTTGITIYYTGDGEINDTVTITVTAVTNAAVPSITAPPSGGDPVAVNGEKILSVTASVTDGGTLTYQWYSNTTDSNTGGTPINGATNASYSVPTSTVGTYYFYVIVTSTNNAVNGTKTQTAKSAAVTVTVTAKTLTSIEVTANPSKTVYTEGDYFSNVGMEITAHYDDGSSLPVAGYTWPLVALTAGQQVTVTITYVEAGTPQTANVTITVSAAGAPLPEDVAILIQAIDSLPAPDDLREYHAGVVGYLVSEFNALSPENQALVTNYAKLTEAQARIAALLADRQVQVNYSPEPYIFQDMTHSNPDRYKASDGEVPLTAPTSETAAAQGYVFVRWSVGVNRGDGFYVQVTVTSLAEAKAALPADAYQIELRAVFELPLAARQTTLVYVDADGGAELYREVLTDYRSNRYFDSVLKNAILEESRKFAAAFAVDGTPVTYISIGTAQWGNTVPVSVTAIAAREITFLEEDKYCYSLYYNYIQGNVYLNDSISNVTSVLVPVGASVNISVYALAFPNVTDILIDTVSQGQMYCTINPVTAGDTAIAVTFTKTAVTNAVVTIKMDSGYNSYSFTAADWDGKLTQTELDYIYNRYENDDYFIYTYTIGGTAYSFAQLTDVVFPHAAGDVTVVTVNSRYVRHRVYFYVDNQWVIDITVSEKETLAQTISGLSASEQALCSLYFTLTLYTDYARTQPFVADINTYKPTGEFALYAARRTGHTVSFDTHGGDPVGSISVPAYSANNYYTLTLPTAGRSGFAFIGWALTEGGAVISGDYYALYIIANYNAAITLHAVWQELQDTSSASVLGVWKYYDDYYENWYAEFNADGTGRIFTIREINYGSVQAFTYTESEGELTVRSGRYIYIMAVVFHGDDLYLPQLLGERDFEQVNGVSFIEVTIYWANGNTLTVDKTWLASDLTMNDIRTDGSYYNYYADKQLIGSDVPFGTLTQNGKLAIMMIYNNYAGAPFADLELDGGVLNGFPPYIPLVYNSFYWVGKPPAPVKDGKLFIGWFTQASGGVRITENNIYDYLRAGNTLTTLYARYIDNDTVNYSGQNFVGTWTAVSAGGGDLYTYKLVLNADGTYAYTEGRNGILRGVSGLYRLIGGQIVFVGAAVQSDPIYPLSVSGVDVRFAEFNFLVVNGYNVLTKGAVIPVDYSGRSFVGTYRAYYGFLYEDGSKNEMITVISLYFNGTFSIMWIETQTDADGNITDTSTYVGTPGYYRLYDGKLVILGFNLEDVEVEAFLAGFQKDGAPVQNYADFPVLGEWVGDINGEDFSVTFGADGVVLIYEGGYSMLFGYKKVGDAYMATDGDYYIFTFTVDGDALICTIEGSGSDPIRLTRPSEE